MRASIVPVLLVANTGMIVFALTLVLSRGEPDRHLAVRIESPSPASTQPAPTRPGPAVVSSSWTRAEKLRQGEDFPNALVQFAELAAREPSPAVRSLLILREAQCLIALHRESEARVQLQTAGEGPSEIVRAMAKLELAKLDAVERLGLEARREAYESLSADTRFRPDGLEYACDLIIARSMVDQALMLCNSPGTVTDAPPACPDPFAGKTAEDVRELLVASSRKLTSSALDTPISKIQPGKNGRIEIQCDRAPLEDFLGRLAASTNIRFRWMPDVSADARRRSVSLRGELIGSMRAAEIACGQAGLIARFTGEEVVVQDPGALATETQRRELICNEAFSTWRRLLLRSPGAKTAAPGHLLLGTLYEAMGKTASALSEYRYIPQAYPHEKASAEALLRCGRLRMSFQDYAGARSDLLEMLDRYPDHPEVSSMYLSLAECELKIGKVARACQLYMRLYDLGVSSASRASAAVGAGRCLLSLKRPAEAAVWVERYLATQHGTDAHGRAQARALLAKCHSATGQADRAIVELRTALAYEMPEADRIELMLELSEALTFGEQCGRALVAVGNIDKSKLNREQMQRYVVASARLLQRSGLDDKAAGLLRSQMDKTTDPALQARLAVELARCRVTTGDLGEARQLLADSVGKLPPGPEAREAVCYLAEVCLKDHRYEQAMAAAAPLVKADEPQIRERANKVLAQAHLAREEYAKAATYLAAAGGQTGGAKK